MEDRKLAAIVFTDIVGYTKRMETDEENTMRLLARQREVIFPLVEEYGGRVIKEIGDGLMMMFGSAERAVRFAMAVQKSLKDEELTIRAGIHIGDVIFKGDDVFGSAVNIAARIEPLAIPGGICISEDVRNQVRNQGDIITSSIGKKELKGVNEAIQIYRVGPGLAGDAEARTPILKDLWQRRVFQITGIYLAVSILVSMIMGVIVDRYMLSPHLVNLTWFILMSLVPSAILIAYFHGRRGVTKWTKVELIGMPLNVVVAVAILVIVFRGKDLGAITTTLTVENEDGEKIEKLVVKNEFRKNILLYNLENKTGEAAWDYLRYGFPAMIEYDLSQDLFITPEHAIKFYDRMVEAGFEDGVGLPVTLMQRFADQRHMNYFLAGEFNREQEAYALTVKLWDTELTRLISEIQIQDENPFTLVDRLSVELKKAMGLPESHINSTVDLPVSEIFTASGKALYNFSRSLKEKALHNWPGNVQFLEDAIREDDGFALAYMTIALSHFENNDFNAATVALDRAMELLYKLPERLQFVVKYVNYVLDQQPDKAMNVVRMWVDLYPDDLTAHQTMAQRYSVRSMYSEAIQEYKEIIRLDPEQYEAYSTLGNHYLQVGNFDSSLAYYQRYARLLP